MATSKHSLSEVIKTLSLEVNEFDQTMRIVAPDISKQTKNGTANINEKNSRFIDEKVLGTGGMKVIQLQEDCNMKRMVAKATIHPDKMTQNNIDTFVQEARITAALEHPNIVPIYDIGKNEKNEPYFIMKHLDGINLQSILTLIKSENKYAIKHFPLKKRLEFFKIVCQTLAFAHQKGILHLDIKPENVHIAEDGKLYLVDWGISKIIDNEKSVKTASIKNLEQEEINKTMTGYLKGSPGYMAIEQILVSQYKLTQQTDIYGLGGLLYAILTCETPIEGINVDDVLEKTTKGIITTPTKRKPNLKIKKELENIVNKCLQTNPDGRYQSVKALLIDLKICSQVKQEVDKKKNNKKLFIPIIFAIILISCIIIAFLLSNKVEEFTKNDPNEIEILNIIPNSPEEFHTAISKLNPLYKSNAELRQDKNKQIDKIKFESGTVSNISPLRGMSLKYLKLSTSYLKDISPLEGMPLREIYLYSCIIENIDALKGMPLKIVWIGNNPIKDINILKGAPIKDLWIGGTLVEDLRPVIGMPLEQLWLEDTNIKSIDVIRGMKLKTLDISSTNVKDISPIKDMPLVYLSLPPLEQLNEGWEDIVKDIKTLKGLSTKDYDNIEDSDTAEKFWKEYKIKKD